MYFAAICNDREVQISHDRFLFQAQAKTRKKKVMPLKDLRLLEKLPSPHVPQSLKSLIL